MRARSTLEAIGDTPLIEPPGLGAEVGAESLGEEVLADCPAVTDFVTSVGTGACSMGRPPSFARPTTTYGSR